MFENYEDYKQSREYMNYCDKAVEFFSLYKKFGFVEYGIRKKYYGENDAVLMKLDSKNF